MPVVVEPHRSGLAQTHSVGLSASRAESHPEDRGRVWYMRGEIEVHQ